MRRGIRTWLGQARPRRHCTFVGGRSVLEHALARAAGLGDQVLWVTSPEDGPFLPPDDRWSERRLDQPADRGSATAVLAAAAHLLAEDAEAVVALLPADHFVYPADRFLDHLRRAGRLVDRHPHRAVLLGAVPDGPDRTCGWIVPGPGPGDGSGREPGVSAVRALDEALDAGQARSLLAAGALWNTSTVVARLDTLWRLGRRSLPETHERLDTLRRVLAAIRQGRVPVDMAPVALAHAYRGLEPADLRWDLLARSSGDLLTLPMDGVMWSEWSRPEQVRRTLDGLGRQSAFTLNRISPAGALPASAALSAPGSQRRQRWEGSSP